MAVKFHHKLFVLNQYLRKDFQLAEQKVQSQASIIDRAISTLGKSLNDVTKAHKMKHLLTKVSNFYLNSSKEYCLPTAIFVSKHKVLTKSDYLKLKNDMPSMDFDLKEKGRHEYAKE